jgi:hypothetical protein
MINKSFFPIILAENFFGVNSRDSEENKLIGEWDESSLNVFSDPQGAVGSRPGYTQITSASIGSVTAWCGFYQFDKLSGGTTTSYYLGGASNGKIYSFTTSAYTELFTGLTTTKGINKRYAFFTLDNTVLITCDEDYPLVWAGTGSATTFATSITADWGLEWQGYPWLHSVVDSRLLYYGTLRNPDAPYTLFLNFDEDSGPLTGGCKQGDDMLVGKENSLFRVQYRGTDPLFEKHRISSKVGPVNYWVMKELPDGRVIFLAPDFNFYMVSSETPESCGDNIQGYIKKGVNSRIKYAVSGLMLNRNQYWCSFTYVSGATTNDRTVVMDWSRPYINKWGKRQYPWFIYSVGANCFADVTISGRGWLYSGGYVGKMYKQDTGTNDNGATFSSSYVSKRISHGDPALEKKYENINLNFARKGDWDMNIQIICDGNAATEKLISQNLLDGLGYQSKFDVAKFDEDYFSSESDSDVTREIKRQGKDIQVTIGTDGLDESWNLYNYTLHAKAIGRGVRVRETT